MKTKIIAMGLILGLATIGAGTSTAFADGNRYEKRQKQIRKQQKKYYNQMRKQHERHYDRDDRDRDDWHDNDHHNRGWDRHDWDDYDRDDHRGWYRNHRHHGNYGYSSYYRHYYRPHRVDYPEHDSENWGIYTTPGGGLGFYYSESEGRGYRYPFGYFY